MKRELFSKGKYQYKYLLFLAVLYNLVFVLAGIGLHKAITIFGLHIAASTLIFPLAFIFNDIIAEVYGYQVSRQLIWSIVPLTIFYQGFLLIIIHGFSEESLQYTHAYKEIFQGMGWVGFLGNFGVVLGFFLNSYILVKWKILLKGRYFWLRSVGSSFFNELIQLSAGVLGIYISTTWFFDDIFRFFISALVFRLFVISICAVPAIFIARFLSKAEGVYIYEENTNFSPFRLKID